MFAANLEPSERGAAAGTSSIFLDLGLGLGPIGLGLFVDAWGIPSAFAVASAVAFAGFGWTLLLIERQRAGDDASHERAANRPGG